MELGSIGIMSASAAAIVTGSSVTYGIMNGFEKVN